MHARKGTDGSVLQVLCNHVMFVAAAENVGDAVRCRMRSRLALQRLQAPDRPVDLAEHQQEKIRDLQARPDEELAIAVQQCYRHVFYPSRNRIGTRGVDLAHTAVDIPSASNHSRARASSRSRGRYGISREAARRRGPAGRAGPTCATGPGSGRAR